MTPTLRTITRWLSPWRTIRRLEVENRRLETKVSRLKKHVVLRSQINKEARSLISQLSDQLAVTREALWRLQHWGGWPFSPASSWDIETTVAVADWLRRGMTGPLLPLPEHLTHPKGQADAGEGL